MSFVARAPGKLVVLGEYAVLEGAEALVMAVDRYCVARIGAADADRCTLKTRMFDESLVTFAPGEPSGIALVDLVTASLPAASAQLSWSACLDSSAFFDGPTKLGLGSSAAAMCAFSGAWWAFVGAGAEHDARPPTGLLISLHRRLQGGGSGLDIAAAVTGGLISYRLDSVSMPRIGSVRLPKGVGFAGIFAGKSARTPDFVAKYEAWRTEEPSESAGQLDAMRSVSTAGCEAIRRGDVNEFLAAVREYGRQLSRLGQRLGRDIVTPEHREIADLADRYGVAYKVSGAGGGDLGLAFSNDTAALEAFEKAVRETRYVWIELALDTRGLTIEEHLSERESPLDS